MAPHPPFWIPYLTVAVVGVVLVLRLRRMGRVSRLRLGALWIAPALLAVVAGAMLWDYPPRGALGWLWLALALGVGAGIGWYRARLMRITVDPETHALNQQASPAALLLVVLLLVARRGLGYEAAALGLNMLQVTGILSAFLLGLVAATRAEMFVRARRLLAEARAQSGSLMSIGPTRSR